MSDPALYLTDLRAEQHSVTYEAHPEGGYRVKGLPILKPGTYHGIAFDAGHLEEIATNFQASKDELGYEPPLRPFHVKPGERVDVRKDLLGVLEDCYLEGDVLKTDARVFDEGTVQSMQSGQFPYLSGEFRINPAQRDGRTSLRGLAFVDAPECKGLPWKLVMNAEDFPAEWQAEPPPVPAVPVPPAAPVAVPTPRGGDFMTLSERIKALFGKGEVTEAAVLAVLEEPQEDPEVTALRERAEQAEAALKAAKDREAEAEAERHLAEVAQQDAADKATVETLLSEKRILPAQQDACLVVLSALRGQDAVVHLAEGGEATTPATEAFVAMLRDGATISDRYFKQGSTPAPSGEADSAMVERMAAAVGIPKS